MLFCNVLDDPTAKIKMPLRCCGAFGFSTACILTFYIIEGRRMIALMMQPRQRFSSVQDIWHLRKFTTVVMYRIQKTIYHKFKVRITITKISTKWIKYLNTYHFKELFKHKIEKEAEGSQKIRKKPANRFELQWQKLF